MDECTVQCVFLGLGSLAFLEGYKVNCASLQNVAAPRRLSSWYVGGLFQIFRRLPLVHFQGGWDCRLALPPPPQSWRRPRIMISGRKWAEFLRKSHKRLDQVWLHLLEALLGYTSLLASQCTLNETSFMGCWSASCMYPWHWSIGE
jgi:hypothetical protein